MACRANRGLENEMYSEANHLQMRLNQSEGNIKFDLAEIKRMAQELIDSIDGLKKHQAQHKCGGRRVLISSWRRHK
jgi:coenzyme F420-reducing hydrogenase alpha subunit